MKTQSIGFKIEPEIRQKIETKAKAQRRTISDYIYRLILKDLKLA